MTETWVTLNGNVGNVTSRELAGGGRYVQLRVASTPRRLVEGQWVDGVTAWHTVKMWRGLAEHVARAVSVGDPVLVHGRLVAEEWTRGDGTTATENVVLATALGLDLARGGARQRPPVLPGEGQVERAGEPGSAEPVDPGTEEASGDHAA